MKLKNILQSAIIVCLVAILFPCNLVSAASSSSLSRAYRPDLTITNVQVNPANPTTSDQISLKITIKNIGRATARNFIINAENLDSDYSYYYDEEDLSSDGDEDEDYSEGSFFELDNSIRVKSLAARKSKTVTIPLPYDIDQLEDEEYEADFEIMVDALNTVKEKKESNNFKKYNFTVTAREDCLDEDGEYICDDDYYNDNPTIPSSSTLSGGIYENTLLPLSKSPYNVTGDVTVFPNVNLTVEPGVEIRFNTNTKLTIRGSLISEGNSDKQIIFTSNNSSPAKGNWGGIYIANNQGGKASLKYTTVSYAEKAFSVECCHTGGPFNVSYSSFLNNNTALGGYDGANNKINVDHTLFENNTNAITDADKIITNSTFKNNKYGLSQTERINVIGSAFTGHDIALWGGRGIVKNSSITNNKIGIQSFFEGFNLSYNTITSNEIGVVLGSYDNSAPPLNYNNIYSNSVYNVKHTASTTVNAKNNWWGTTDLNQISASIYDGKDNTALGLITINPIYNCLIDITKTNLTCSDNPITPATLSISVAPFPETYIYLEIPQGKTNINFVTYNFQTGKKPVYLKHFTVKSATDNASLDISKYISKIKLTSDRHGTIGITNNFNGTANFTGLNLSLPANSLTKFQIYADAAKGASVYPMGVKLGFADANGIGAYDQNGTTINLGNTAFPLMSNKLDIVDSGAFIIRNQTQNSNMGVNAGSSNITMLKFRLEATLESFNVNSLSIGINGQNYITKLSLYDDQGKIYAGGGVQIDPNGNLSVPLNPTSLTIPAGSGKNMNIKADFSTTAPANSTYSLTLKNIRATGLSSGMMKPSSPNYQGNTISIAPIPVQIGTLGTYPLYPQDPDTTVNPGATNVTMLKFGIAANNVEDFKINDLLITLSGPNNISKAYLQDEQGIIYDSCSPSSSSTGYYLYFQKRSLVIKAGSSKNMIIKTDFRDQAEPNSVNQLYLKSISGTGISSEKTQNIEIYYPGNHVTISSAQKTGTFIINNSSQNPDVSINQGGAAVMLKFVLESTAVEDFTVKNATIFVNGPNNISSLYLYEEQGGQYGYSNIKIDGNGQLYGSINPSSLVIPAGKSRNMMVKAYFSSYAEVNTTNSLTLAKISAAGNSSQVTQTVYPNYQGNKVTIVPIANLLSDLTISNIYFDSQAILNVTIKNIGEGTVPANKGDLLISIDGKKIGGYNLGQLIDQSFRQPGGSTTITTNFRLSGYNRAISVKLDTNNEIEESNETNNVKNVTLTPPYQNGPDFIISDLTRNSDDALVILIKNQGNTQSNSVPMDIRVIVNEQVAGDFNPTIPSLPVGGITAYTPSPIIKITNQSAVRVLINTNGQYDIDNNNGVKEEAFSASTYTTRAELARYLISITGRGVSSTGGPHYPDVPQAHPDYKYIEDVTTIGVMKGYSDGLFRPDEIVNRSEVSKAVVAMFSLPIITAGGPHYQDVQPDSWYYSYIETIVNFLGYSNNDNTSYFHPIDQAVDTFAKDTIEIMNRILLGLSVSHATDNPGNQQVKSGKQKTFLSLSLSPLFYPPLTLEKIQVTAVDENGNQYSNINEILDGLALVGSNGLSSSAQFSNGYLEFTNLNSVFSNSINLKFTGTIKPNAPIGKKFQIQVKKTSVTSPSGVITKDNDGVYNLINFGGWAAFKLFDYKGGINEVIAQ